MKIKQAKPQGGAGGLQANPEVVNRPDQLGKQTVAVGAISFTEADLPEKPPADKWHSHKEENWAAIAEINKLALAKDLEGLRRFRSSSDWITKNYKDVIVSKLELRIRQAAESMKVAETPQFVRSYWAVPGKLLAGCYPGDPDPAKAREKLRALVNCHNIGFIVNLMFADEVNSAGQRFADYRPALEEIACNAGRVVCLAQMPICDNGVPAPAHMRKILDLIDVGIAAGDVVFVHCWGGKGRTGTVIGCYLARHGLACGEAALQLLNNLARTSTYNFGVVPQTQEQCNFVRAWKPESLGAKSEAAPIPKKPLGTHSRPAVGAGARPASASSHGGLTREDRILGGLWGAVVGDALGVPVEFSTRTDVQGNPVTDLRGHGTYNQPKGTWSDDSSLMLCTVDSMLLHDFAPEDMGQRFVQWSRGKVWTPWGKVFDIGGATSRALDRINNGVPAEQAGGTDDGSNGNGSLMRILPVALRLANEPADRLMDYARRASCITHAHPRSQVSCAFYCLVVAGLLRGEAPAAAHRAAAEIVCPLFDEKSLVSERHHFTAALSPDLATMPESAIGSSGYVVDTLTASLWCLLTSSGYSETVLKAVNLGGDTDTTGIAAGGLAGVCYGLAAVPEPWRKAMARAADLEQLFGTFTGVVTGEIAIR